MVLRNRRDLAGLPERRVRGRQLLSIAQAWVPNGLRMSLPWTRCVGLTGSVAFGEPKEHDDLDFFVVTRRGAVWVFLALTYLSVRFRSRPRLQGEPLVACFNFVIDEISARAEFARPQGFQFAREALNMKMLAGESYYRELLRSAVWMATEVPQLYAEKFPSESEPSRGSTPILVRVVNVCIFPLLATYLQFVGLVRNARAHKRGSDKDSFQSRTTLRRLVFTSKKWERLGGYYRNGTVGSPTREPPDRPIPAGPIRQS